MAADDASSSTTRLPIASPSAPPSNQSSLATSSSNQTYPTLTVFTLSTPLYVTGTGNLPVATATPATPTYVKPSNNSSNGTCGCTVNVRGAEIGYWYSLDQYFDIVTFFSIASGTGVTWEYQTATTTFNLVKSVQDGLMSYDLTSAWDPATNQTTWDLFAITLPMPAAATTTVMSMTEYSPIPSTPLTQQNIIDSLWSDLPPASVAFTGPSSTVFVAASGTPFVAYSSYEVEKAEPVVDAFGKVSCKTSVTSYDLSAPYAFEYNGDKLGDTVEASGPVPDDFLQSIPQSSCVAGTYQGPVTIIYIVHLMYGTPWTPFVGHVESSVEQLELPTITAASSSTYRPKAHVESSAEDAPPSKTSKGIVRFHTKTYNDYIAHIESALSEFGLPTVVLINTKSSFTAAGRTTQPAPGGNSATTAPATRLNQNSGDSTSNGGGVPGLGQIISAIVSQVNENRGSSSGGSSQNSGSESEGSGSSGSESGGSGSGSGSSGSESSNSDTGGSSSGSESSNGGSSNESSGSGNGGSESSNGGSSSGSSGPGSSDSDSSSGSDSGSGSDSTSDSSSDGSGAGSSSGNSQNSPPIIVAGSQTATMDSSSGFVIGGQTLSPGGPAITVDGTVLSLVPSATAVVVNGQESSLSGSSIVEGQGPAEIGRPPIITVGSVAYTANAATQYYLAPGQTLTAGGVVTVDGTVVSLGPSASYVVVGGATQTFPSALITPAPNPAFAAGATPTFLIAGQTLTPGGSVVVSGTTISLDSSANNLVVDGVTRAVGAGVGIVGQPLITVAGTPYPAVDGTSFIVGGQVLTPGGVILVDGTTVSLNAADNIVYFNGVASSLDTSYPFSTSPPILTIGGSTVAPEVVGGSIRYEIGGQTLTPGGSISADGTVISLAPGATALVINGVTQALNPVIATSLPDVVIGGTTISGIDKAGDTYVIGGQTLSPGGLITVDGTVFSLAPEGTALVVNGVTQVLGTGITAISDIVVGGTTLSGLFGAGSTYVIAGQTLTIGGTITVDGTTISFPSATAVVINGITQTLIGPAYTTNAPELTIDGTVYTDLPGPGTTYVIDGQTLTPGGVIVVDGTTISLSPSATALVVNGVTQTLFPATTAAAAAATRFPVLTIDGQTYTALPNSGSAGGTYVIDGQTLTPGGVIVVDGTTISLSPSATVLIVNGHTQTLAAASATATTTGASAGSKATAGNGAAATATRTGAAAESTGAASRTAVVSNEGLFSSLFSCALLTVLIGGFAW